MKREIIDMEQFSGHSHEFGGIRFTSTYMMWFGKDFFRFVPQETLTSFNDCVSNETFDNGTVRIQLYEDINDYNTEKLTGVNGLSENIQTLIKLLMPGMQNTVQ